MHNASIINCSQTQQDKSLACYLNRRLFSVAGRYYCKATKNEVGPMEFGCRFFHSTARWVFDLPRSPSVEVIRYRAVSFPLEWFGLCPQPARPLEQYFYLLYRSRRNWILLRFYIWFWFKWKQTQLSADTLWWFPYGIEWVTEMVCALVL